MRKIFFTILALTLFFGAGAGSAMAYSANPALLEAWANDTIAGFSTSIKTSRTLPNSGIVINIDRPDGTRLVFDQITDKNGYAEMTLDNLHTKKAGIYSLAIALKDVGVNGKMNTFKVYPDQVSASESNVLIDKQTLRATGSDYSILNVVLTDKFGNPIANHQVNVISSRSGDKIEPYNSRDYTNANGSVMFKVSSVATGISTYSIYDSTNKIVLSKRVSILYSGGAAFSSSAFGAGLNNAGGNEYLFANTFGPDVFIASANSVSKFEFGEIPAEISKDSVISFSLGALDDKDQIIENYTGGVHFSITGGGLTDAILPDDYTFTATDMGKHIFAKALTFKKAGTYKLQVNDLMDPAVQDEIIVTVKDAGAGQISSSLIEIVNPVQGKYSSSAQAISGVSLPGSYVKIFDNNEEIGSATADLTGAFMFTTPPLSDGMHIIYAAAVNDKGVVLGISNKVAVEIDTTPAAIDSVMLMPDKDISMGSPVLITVVTEPNMTRVAVVIGGGDIVDLESVANMPGTYQGSFQAPAKSGTYGIDIVLTDTLGNEKSYENQKSFNVTEVSAIRPSDVTGLKAFPGNGKVALVWNAATDAKGIARYTVYFGSDLKSMVNAVNTKNSSTTWYVPNLKNGVRYFFAVKAVNKDGNDSAKPSNVVFAAPDENAVDASFPSSLDDETSILYDNFDGYAGTSETGPASAIVFGISGLAGAAAFVWRRRRGRTGSI